MEGQRKSLRQLGSEAAMALDKASTVVTLDRIRILWGLKRLNHSQEVELDREQFLMINKQVIATDAKLEGNRLIRSKERVMLERCRKLYFY